MAEFDKFAAQYDFWTRKVGDPNRHKRYLKFLPPRNELALDVGCGSGWLTLRLSDYVERVVGVDISGAMIGLARQYCIEAQKNNIDLCIADMTRLPFEDETFDYIVSDFSLHDAHVLPALRRLIRPGGRIMLRDLVGPAQRPRKPLLSEHIVNTFKNAKTYLKVHDIRTAWRLLSFEMSPAWIGREFRGKKLSPDQFQEIYGRYLPGCRFEQWANIITVLWEPPPEPNYQHSYIKPKIPIAPAPSPGLPELPQIDFDKEDINKSIPQRFAYIANKYPDTVAVKYGSAALTYSELDIVSNQVAHAILELTGSEAEPVGILIEHGVAPIVAILGVLKAGKFYVAMDPSHPENHLRSIIEDAAAKMVVIDTKTVHLASELGDRKLKILNLDEIDRRYSKEKIDIPVSAETLAAIFYTSGSTGRPKGVLRNHRSILHLAWGNARCYGITNRDRHSFLFFSGFDASVPDIYTTLLNGATLCPYPLQKRGIARFSDWLVEENVTLLHPPVTFFREFMSSIPIDTHFPKLRLTILAGQSVYRQDVERFRKTVPANSALILIYASSEAGRITAFRIDQHTELSDGRQPAGYPFSGKQVLVLGDGGQSVASGQAGQIAVRSRYLSLGYWGQPDMTDEKFLEDSEGGDERIFLTGDLGKLQPDGCLEYLGRMDSQVKIRGYRIELAEIEAALYRLDCVREAAAVVKGEPEDPFIVAYWVPSAAANPDSGKLREMLAEFLPAYMMPSRFVVLERMPMASAGKIDRRQLPEPGRGRRHLTTAFIAGNDYLERHLTEIWQDIFGISPIGIEDNFFDLGGDSMKGFRLAAKIENILGRPFSTATLWKAPTIAQQAKILGTQRSGRPHRFLVPIQPNGDNPALFYIPPSAATLIGAQELVDHLGPDFPFYGLQPKGMDRDGPPHTRVEMMAADFLQEIRQVQKKGPYFLAGMCFGGIVAFEMAQQLTRQGQQVALLAVLDTLSPPGFHRSSLRQMKKKLSSYQQWPDILRVHLRRLGEYLQTQQLALPRRLFVWLEQHYRIFLARAVFYTQPIRTLFTMNAPERRRIRSVMEAHRQARKVYIPQLYPGKITLFFSEQPAPQRNGWHCLSSQPTETHMILGNHRTMLKAPYVRVLAKKLKAQITQAYSQQTGDLRQ